MPTIDAIFLVVACLIAWWVAGDGFFSAAMTLLAVLFAGLAAMNFFEPLAEWLETIVPADSIWARGTDVIALVGLFLAFVLLLRACASRALRDGVAAHPLVEEPGRWICGAAAGYAASAFLLAALHTAPVPREFLGFTPERRCVFGLAPDRQWLGFTQYVSEHVFPRKIRLADGREAKRIFDGTPHVTPEGRIEYRSSFPIRYAHRRANPAVRAD